MISTLSYRFSSFHRSVFFSIVFYHFLSSFINVFHYFSLIFIDYIRDYFTIFRLFCRFSSLFTFSYSFSLFFTGLKLFFAEISRVLSFPAKKFTFVTFRNFRLLPPVSVIYRRFFFVLCLSLPFLNDPHRSSPSSAKNSNLRRKSYFWF